MNKTFIKIALIVILLVIPTISYSNPVFGIPTSSRSSKAIKKVTPNLKKELAELEIEFGSHIFLRLFKLPAKLEVWLKSDDKFVLFKSYRVCTYGSEGLGPKSKQGDGKAPEGFYYVKPNQLNPVSNFHLSFNLGYPNKYDRAYKRTGSALMVHGNCVSIGCYAMTDTRIEEIYTLADAALRNGQGFFRVHIFPFPMTEANMKKHIASKWFDFWLNLKEGYDYFERLKLPPNVEVRNRKYVFDF